MIDSLLEALQVSPDNIPLRLQVAQLLLKDRSFTEAAEQFQRIEQEKNDAA